MPKADQITNGIHAESDQQHIPNDPKPDQCYADRNGKRLWDGSEQRFPAKQPYPREYIPHRRDPCHGNHHGMKPQSIIKMKMQHRIHRSGSPAERAIDMKPIMQDANRDDRENRCCANAKKRKQHDRKSRRHMKSGKPNQRCPPDCHTVFPPLMQFPLYFIIKCSV